MILLMIALICVALFASLIVLYLALSVVALSKIVFPLLVAFIVNNNTPILSDRPFWSFVIWAVLFLILCFTLCRLPRFNCAFQFFCNYFIAYFITAIIVTICLSIFTDMDSIPLGGEIAIKVGCFIVSVLGLLSQLRQYLMHDISKYKALVIIDRVLASIVYGIIVLLIFSFTANSVWSIPVVLQWVIFIGTIILAYLLDHFLFTAIYNKMLENVDRWDAFVAEGEENRVGLGTLFAGLALSIAFLGTVLAPPYDDDDDYNEW